MFTDRTERSTSRGRVLTGRGGVGNFRSPSTDRAVNGPEDYSDPRGRDLIPAGDPDAVISTGRGGRGNIRSPSREPVQGDGFGDTASLGVSPARSLSRGRSRTYDHESIISIDSARDNGVHSFGRGGSGNMTVSPQRDDSKSRSRSREPAAHATGRGGVGNLYLGGPSEKVIEEQDEAERASHSHEPGMHSVNRGGYGNLTASGVPYSKDGVNPHGANHPHATHSHLVETVGRGGFGNSVSTTA